MKLYGYWRSSSTYRLRIALALKELSFDTVVVSLLSEGGQQNLPDFLKKNPMAQVPVLEVEEGAATHYLTQTVAIFEYLEERFPQSRLLPLGRIERAEVRRAVEICNSGIQPLQNLALLRSLKQMGADEIAFARAANEKGLAAIEEVASRVSAGFVVGDQPTYADVCLIPQLFSARRFGANLAPLSRLLEIEARCNAMAAFAGAHPDRQPDAEPARA